MSSVKVYFIGCSFLGFLGIMMIYFSLSEYRIFLKLKYGRTEIVEGLVIEKHQSKSEFGIVPMFEIEFLDYDGNKHFIRNVFSSKEYDRKYRVGQKVEVIYYKPNPSIARINTWQEKDLSLKITFFFNLLLLLLGVVALFLYAYKKDEIFSI